MMKKKEKNKSSKRRITLRVFLGITLIGLSFLLFGATYILRLDAWNNFDASKILDVPKSVLIYDKDGQEVSVLSRTENRIPVSIDLVPDLVKKAFISAEDARFYEHNGIDIIRILGAAWEDIKAGSYVQGASTISQQLIKLSHLTPDKNIMRKLEEAILSYQMETQFEKDEILEMYLNYVYFGGGYYGIEAAARGYFGVHTEDLTVAQGAMLAGILKSPSNYAPHLDMEASVKRRNLILNLMHEYGYIDQQTCTQARSETVSLVHGKQTSQRGYYIDLALQQACEVLHVDMDELLTGGYRIHTALNSELQKYCETAFLNPELFPDQEGVQAAFVLVNTKTSGVEALMGGRESTNALEYNRAVQIRRQPGSVIKPIIAYAPALEEFDYTTVSMLLDEPTDFNGYQPSNFGNRYSGWVTMREAVSKSLNVPAVKVLAEIGVETGKNFAENLGIPFDQQDTSLALALGGFTYGVSPYQIAGSYAAFSAGGIYSTPSLVMRITSDEGEVLYEYQPEQKRVMSEENAYILTSMLESTIQTGTGKRLKTLDIPLAGKTGTTGEDEGGNRDAWMAAYNAEYAGAVWMGYDDASNGQALAQEVTGGTYPALILGNVFSKIYEEKQAPDFVMPDGVQEYKLDQYSLQESHVAVLANALTPQNAIVREVFRVGTEPQGVNEYWVIPSPPTHFSLTLDQTGRPVLSFEPVQTFILYQLFREDRFGNTVLLHEWPGSEGAIEYVDQTAQENEVYVYYVLPLHPQLRINDRPVTGPATQRLTIDLMDADQSREKFFLDIISDMEPISLLKRNDMGTFRCKINI